MTTAAPPTARGLSTLVLGLSLLVVAANLRPTLTALGPVLGLVAQDTGLSPSTLGLLGSVPLLAFAGVSPFVQLLSRRWGPDHTVFAATTVMLLATVVRSLPGQTVTLWAGTIALGAGIAVCNVLVPALVKRDFPREVPLMTGAYTATLSLSAALASGLALPIGERGGWRVGIAVWGVVGVLALLAWLPRLRRHERDVPVPVAVVLPRPGEGRTGRGRSMWRSPLAWQVTAFMGTQAIFFYLLVTWLPSIEVARGVGPVAAGWHLFLFQATGIAGGLLVSLAMRGRRDHRLAGVGVSLGMAISMTGLLLLPALDLGWLVVGGLSSGASLVVALSLVAERSRTTADAARLSGMVQSIGYLLGIIGPIGAGALFQATGTWSAVLVGVVVVNLVQLLVSLLAGRDAYVEV
ncbi:MFS transporter [Microlunatus flavus]|uniref:MFS transporter, CP family, cyanate transporter n=1 Tax=Microlunatus flavus TaxID=1036181 RepID=A0A1H9HBX0_9ACTN|nr:MFS transporter [Microlunatus flavus]SEQ59839.1 MFS transporter, CP family, cyanate transporter [Microlunatus flavus]